MRRAKKAGTKFGARNSFYYTTTFDELGFNEFRFRVEHSWD
jgi:hypothetical protein